MSKISAETLAEYQQTLKKDPASKVFAPLADAYRELGQWGEAELLARNGIKRHPDYVGGYLVLARILLATRRAADAEPVLKKAVELSPENLLVYQLLGQAFVALKRPQDALKAHKMVLFLNPLSEKSRHAVEKLESLSAADYEDEIFEMRPLQSAAATVGGGNFVKPPAEDRAPGAEKAAAKIAEPAELDRSLSLIDALIVRNDLDRAKTKLIELSEQFPDSPQVKKRWTYFEDDSQEEEIETLRPILSREKQIVAKKKAVLEAILTRIDRAKAHMGLDSGTGEFPQM